ncbi:MAG: TIM barrel protein [Bryobacteraceae bacterium]|nr:TIM barrel protein [Bryobacteraceae bacterium]
MTRRTFLPSLAGATALAAYAQSETPKRRPGRLKQAICPGALGRMPLEDKCRIVADLGLYGIDLIGPKDWPTLKKYGLIPTMCPGGGTIPVGLNRPENHARFEKDCNDLIDQCATNGVPNLIGLTGSRAGQPVEKGIENTVAFCNKIKSHLEDKNVTFCIEYLNSKVNHPDYDFDHMNYGVEVCKRVNSPRVKILYDMYHVQIMEGDIIRMAKQHLQYIAHLHTAGNPGRHEMDDTQEMNYRGIAKALADMGYSGFISHEYSPTRDPLASLKETLQIFDAA